MFSSMFSVCLSVINFAQKLRNGFARNFQGRLAMGQWTIKFWWRFGSWIRIRTRIQVRVATLVRRALVETCTVPLLLVILYYYYFAPGAKYCDERFCMSVCLSVCPLAYLKIHLSKLHEIFCTCYTGLWLGLLLTTVWYIMYFPFCGWRHVFS